MTQPIRSLAEISEAVDAAYQSRFSPNFHFVSRKRALQKYAPVLSALEQSFRLTDTTDENDDVSIVLALDAVGASWTLYLSMVGSFAGLVEWRGSSARLVDDLSAGPDPLRASILEVLEREGVAIVRGSILFEPFPIRLGDGEPGHHTVFRVLFSDIDPLPASASGS